LSPLEKVTFVEESLPAFSKLAVQERRDFSLPLPALERLPTIFPALSFRATQATKGDIEVIRGGSRCLSLVMFEVAL
jgi:hypothetical protein